MRIRALIVDDEVLARGRLRKLLAGEPDLEIMGECSNGVEAIACIREQRPDLVFLDVQMPEVSGFDVLRALPEATWPAVIFVTAHDQHAIAAFEVHAVDYLLKPFAQARLLAAVQRARQHLQARDLAALNQQLAVWLKSSAAPQPVYLSRIAVKTGKQTLFVRVEDIDYIEAAANYAVLQTRGENHILRETLTNLEAKLPPRLFLRISRSIIVNLERIKGIQSAPGGRALAPATGWPPTAHDPRSARGYRNASSMREPKRGMPITKAGLPGLPAKSKDTRLVQTLIHLLTDSLSSTQKRLPFPGSDSTPTRPPIRSATLSTIANPIPVPSPGLSKR